MLCIIFTLFITFPVISVFPVPIISLLLVPPIKFTVPLFIKPFNISLAFAVNVPPCIVKLSVLKNLLFSFSSNVPSYKFTVPVYPLISSFKVIFPFAINVVVEELIFKTLVLFSDVILSLKIISAFVLAHIFIIPLLVCIAFETVFAVFPVNSIFAVFAIKLRIPFSLYIAPPLAFELFPINLAPS